jgi:hypothetical protein
MRPTVSKDVKRHPWCFSFCHETLTVDAAGPEAAFVRVGDDPLRDPTQHSLNAHEVLPRRDVHLAAAEAATLPYKCLAKTNVIESPQSGVARRTANVTRWCDREMVERWVAFGLAAQGEELPQNRGPSRSVGVGHDLGPSTSRVQPIAGEASVK